jgi:hypothetical protein
MCTLLFEIGKLHPRAETNDGLRLSRGHENKRARGEVNFFVTSDSIDRILQ